MHTDLPEQLPGMLHPENWNHGKCDESLSVLDWQDSREVQEEVSKEVHLEFLVPLQSFVCLLFL